MAETAIRRSSNEAQKFARVLSDLTGVTRPAKDKIKMIDQFCISVAAGLFVALVVWALERRAGK
jgi:hypothetical protein